MRTVSIFLFSMLLVFGMAFSQDATGAEDNQELQALEQADQADRKAFMSGEKAGPDFWREVSQRDLARRERVLEMLHAGDVRTPNDFYAAALILQHGDQPQHYLLSHVLATVAGFKGHEGGRWLSAAALDRYLQKIDRAQIFGTQKTRQPGQDWTMEPFQRDLIPDSVRREFAVPPLEQTGSGG